VNGQGASPCGEAQALANAQLFQTVGPWISRDGLRFKAIRRVRLGVKSTEKLGALQKVEPEARITVAQTQTRILRYPSEFVTNSLRSERIEPGVDGLPISSDLLGSSLPREAWRPG